MYLYKGSDRLFIFPARKRSLRRLCFYTCLSFCPQGGGPGGVWYPGTRGVSGTRRGAWSRGVCVETPTRDGYCCRRLPKSYWNAFLLLLHFRMYLLPGIPSNFGLCRDSLNSVNCSRVIWGKFKIQTINANDFGMGRFQLNTFNWFLYFLPLQISCLDHGPFCRVNKS